MDNSITHRAARRTARILLTFLTLAAVGPSQSPCYHFGSVPRPATWERSPSQLGCPNAPDWPAWHLFTPAHRAPTTHAGFNPGNAIELPRVIVIYRCTGFLLVPVVIAQVRTMGYVVDQPEIACAPGSITS